MSRGRQATRDQKIAVQLLALAGHKPAEVYRMLEEKGLLKDPNPDLGRRTIERMVRDAKPLDPSGPWSFAAADPEEARLVLDVVVWVFHWSKGRTWLTNEVTSWVARVREAAPGVPTNWAYHLAIAYQGATQRRQDSRSLDVVLAVKPWEVEGAEDDEGEAGTEFDRRYALMQWAHDELGPPDMHIDHLIA